MIREVMAVTIRVMEGHEHTIPTLQELCFAHSASGEKASLNIERILCVCCWLHQAILLQWE